MAFSFIQGKEGITTNSHSSAVTLAAAVGTGHALCVGIVFLTAANNVVTPFTITDNSGGGANTYNLVDTLTGANSTANGLATFYAANVTGAPTIFTVNCTGAKIADALEILVDEFSGVATTSVLDGHKIATGAFTTAANNVTGGNYTTSTNGDLLWGIGSIWGSGNLSAGTAPISYSLGQNNAGDSATEYATQATATTSTVANFTISVSGTITVGALALKAAQSVSTVTNHLLSLTGVGI
jgi:hypothetical protein